MVIRCVNNANRVSKNAFNTIGKIQKGIRYNRLEFHFRVKEVKTDSVYKL